MIKTVWQKLDVNCFTSSILYAMYSVSVELLIFCGCSLGERAEGRAFEKGTAAAVVRMRFGHWVPLLVRTEPPKPFSRGGTSSTLKNGGLCYSGNSEGLRPLSQVVLLVEKHIPEWYKE